MYSRGENNRFLHPNDPGWQHMGQEKPLPKGPLASQSHLFQRHKRERSPSPGYARQNRHTSLTGRGNRVEDESRSDIGGPRMRCTPGKDAISERKKALTSKRSVPQGRDEPEITANVVEGQAGSQVLQVAQEVGRNTNVQQDKMKHDRSTEESRSDEIWNAFSLIARLSRESDILEERQRKEESKFATYTAIGETLNGISDHMGETVNPQISQSALVRDDCIKTIKKKNETIRKIWGEAIQSFVADVTREVDGHVQIVMQKMRNEAESMSNGIILASRKRNQVNLNSVPGPLQKETISGEYPSHESGDGIYRTKRRRVRAQSQLSPLEPPQKDENMAASLDVIREMKIKIEQQAQALAVLAKENEELRAAAGKETLPEPSTPLR